MTRQDRGRRAYLEGDAAECGILARYVAQGFEPLARRWRGRAGEIDLILRKGGEVVFVEVKKAATLAQAAERLSAAQLSRIFSAGAEFLDSQPLGQLTPVRVDLALVDGTGRHDVIENVMPA